MRNPGIFKNVPRNPDISPEILKYLLKSKNIPQNLKISLEFPKSFAKLKDFELLYAYRGSGGPLKSMAQTLPCRPTTGGTSNTQAAGHAVSPSVVPLWICGYRSLVLVASLWCTQNARPAPVNMVIKMSISLTNSYIA